MGKTVDTTPEESTGVVDIITQAPGAFEEFTGALDSLPPEYQDESWLLALAGATSLADIDENFLGALTQVYGSSLIAKEDLISRPFVVLSYRRTIGNYKHADSGEFLSYYTLRVLTDQGKGSVILSGTGMAPVFETLEASGKRPPYMVPKGLRRSDDWFKDGERMNGTWYLG